MPSENRDNRGSNGDKRHAGIYHTGPIPLDPVLSFLKANHTACITTEVLT